jgi:hypothetical protein
MYPPDVDLPPENGYTLGIGIIIMRVFAEIFPGKE